MKLVLASKSPRRSEILENAGIDFIVRVADADETIPEGTKPEDAVVFLAARKAMAVPREKDEVILGADTVVVLDGNILGKPKDKDDAFNMIKMLSGRVHSVFTGVCAIGDGMSLTFAEETKVEFYPLSDKEINDYINTNEPYDKAGVRIGYVDAERYEWADKCGAYAIQGKSGAFIKNIEGDYFNVMGLPFSRLYCELKRLELI